MVLTRDQKAVIKNDFEEKGMNAYQIWKDHPSFKCSRVTINNLINKIKETGSASRRKGTGTTVSAVNEENAEIS